MKISDILAQIDLGAMALPEFQRGYVWNRIQVRDLMTSLYRRFPVGSLLVWATHSDQAQARGNGDLWSGTVELILDGQQRITTLYGIIRGKPPAFFQGDANAFSNLYFNLDHPDLLSNPDAQPFKFYSPLEMKDNPYWINVTELMQQGPGAFIPQLTGIEAEQLTRYFNRLNDVYSIQSIDLHIEKVTGADKTIDVVVAIFNKVNSGGTKLSKGDLALAKICAGWPEARHEMLHCLSTWEQAGFNFTLDWLLRNVTTISTGQAMFSDLAEVSINEFKHGLAQAERLGNYLLNVIGGRLGLDHDRVLGGRYAFPVMTRYLHLRGGKFQHAQERDRLLYWYIHSFLWGRFTGSTESVLNQDLQQVKPAQIDAALDGLIANLRRMRGDLTVRADDFSGNSLGARFYPLLYLLTRVSQARDWGNGLPLSANMLGKHSSLHIHHIFPKALLYDHGYSRAEVNALANFCFLTQDANLTISDQDPATYLPQIEGDHPGALASQWVPMDSNLWRIERYRDFLAARRELLAQAANAFLESLLTGAAAAEQIPPPAEAPSEPLAVTALPGGISSDEEAQNVQACHEWVMAQGLPSGEELYELTDPTTGQPVAILDLAWPRGVQEGLTQPVAVLLDESRETEELVNRAGYRFFTSVAAFRDYVERDILAVDGVLVGAEA
jgi:hypothetical protein